MIVEKTLTDVIAEYRRATKALQESELAKDMRLWSEDEYAAYRVAAIEVEEALHEAKAWKARLLKELQALEGVLRKEHVIVGLEEAKRRILELAINIE